MTTPAEKYAEALEAAGRLRPPTFVIQGLRIIPDENNPSRPVIRLESQAIAAPENIQGIVDSLWRSYGVKATDATPEQQESDSAKEVLRCRRMIIDLIVGMRSTIEVPTASSLGKRVLSVGGVPRNGVVIEESPTEVHVLWESYTRDDRYWLPTSCVALEDRDDTTSISGQVGDTVESVVDGHSCCAEIRMFHSRGVMLIGSHPHIHTLRALWRPAAKLTVASDF